MKPREQGTGPFRVATKKDRLWLPDFAHVLDCTDEVFCHVDPHDCHSAAGDMTGALSRAQRIAESLNRTEGHT